jgi:tetratricopeptide (TPR) repeat protein
VYVTAALSPWAHPIRPTLVEVLATQKVAIANGPTSELLGPMVALDDMGKVVQTLAADPMREPLYMTAHVIVGFDDSKQLIMMHDATFGPATEMSYADFEKAWKASGSEMTVIRPADRAAVVARRAGAAPYRNRTADERAAEGYITAYTLAATGKLADAEQTLRRTLSGVEASDGYKHLLNLELAMVLESQQRGPEALKAWEETVKYLPDIPIAWQHMATMYKKVAKDDRLAAYALQQYTALKKDPNIRKRMAAALPGDFLLVPFRDVRGWCGF